MRSWDSSPLFAWTPRARPLRGRSPGDPPPSPDLPVVRVTRPLMRLQDPSRRRGARGASTRTRHRHEQRRYRGVRRRIRRRHSHQQSVCTMSFVSVSMGTPWPRASSEPTACRTFCTASSIALSETLSASSRADRSSDRPWMEPSHPETGHAIRGWLAMRRRCVVSVTRSR